MEPALAGDYGDWDVLILHYLGLDHIGHSLGPSSSLVGPKLEEMGRVIERVYEYLAAGDPTSVLVVLGDHGMTHVFSSPSPLLLLPPDLFMTLSP